MGTFLLVMIVFIFLALIIHGEFDDSGGCLFAAVILVIGIFCSSYLGFPRDHVPEPAAVVLVAPSPPQNDKKVNPVSSEMPSSGQLKTPKLSSNNKISTANSPNPTIPNPFVANQPEEQFSMNLPTLFAVGGIIFWALLVVELVGLYLLVEYENGLWAGGLLAAFITMLFLVSNLTLVDTVGHIQGHRIIFYGGILSYGLIGIGWMFARWTWLGISRRDRYTALRDQWLSERGLGLAKAIPDHLLEEWHVYVKGDPGGSEVQSYLRTARRSWNEENSMTLEESQKRQRPTAIIPDEISRRSGQVLDNWVNFAVHDLLPYDSKSSATLDMKNARKLWLKDLGIFDSTVIPPEYKDWFKRRIINIDFAVTTGNPELKELSEVPSVWKRIGRLTRWWAWWPLDMVVFFLNDFLIRFGKFLVYRCRAILQGIMDKIYAPIRGDFRPPSDKD